MSASPYSVLDLVPVTEGSVPAESFRRSRDLARHAEGWGYQRYWLAEHHNMPGIASTATSVLIGHLAEATTTLQIGAGGLCPLAQAPCGGLHQHDCRRQRAGGPLPVHHSAAAVPAPSSW